MGQLFLIGFRNLLQHRRRTLLLASAIAGVTALLVFLMSLSQGMQETLMRSATTLVTGHVNVGGFYKLTEGSAAPVVTNYQAIEPVLREALGEDILYISDRGRGWAKLVSDTGSMQVGVGGVVVDNEQGFRETLAILEGNLEGLREPNTVLIFAEQARKLGVKVGDMLTLSAPTLRGVNNTSDLRVVAVAQNVGMLSGFNIFVPAQSLRALYQLNESSTGAIHIYLRNPDDIGPVSERVRTALEKAGHKLMEKGEGAFWMKFETVNREAWTGQKLDVTSWRDEVSFLEFALMGINGLSVVLTIVLLVIIAVGLVNTLWVSIRERTREIGTLRAIGMQRRRVLGMFVVEAFLLAGSATMAGALLGVLLCLGLNALHIHVPEAVANFLMTDTLTLAPGVVGIVGAVILITACTTAFALLPSFLAARMRPVTAMHHVG